MTQWEYVNDFDARRRSHLTDHGRRIFGRRRLSNGRHDARVLDSLGIRTSSMARVAHQRGRWGDLYDQYATRGRARRFKSGARF
jgi:hypothetical protein